MEEKKDNIKKSSDNPSESISRRNFLKIAGVAAGAAAVTATLGGIPLLKDAQAATTNKAPTTTAIVPLAFYQSTGIQKFIQPMRSISTSAADTGIPVAVPDGTTGVGGAIHYNIDVAQYTDTLHPSLGLTTLRGYKPQNALGGTTTQRHLGGIIVANKGAPVQITFNNNLTGPHPIPIDQTIMGADGGENRTCTHLHGGLVPWISDGGPYAWFAPGDNYGPSVPITTYNTAFGKTLTDGQAEYYYPNNQSARMLWYHDHTLGITRMNAYIGIASAYIIRDTFEGNLRGKGMPDFIENGGREIPIIIQDKIFVDSQTINNVDPLWTGPKTTGSLWYAHTYDPDRWDLTPGKTPPEPSVIPEFFGDTMLANGLVYPFVEVEPRRYRLRILNACQARFLNLQMYVDDGSTDSITLTKTLASTWVPTNAKGPDFLVLGTEGGFLPNPVLMPSNKTFNPQTLGGSLITAPAERWDLIVDFSAFAGKKIILYNDAPAPFPMGDPINDYFPGNADNPTTTNPGKGPNSRQILQFKVKETITGPADRHLNISSETDLSEGNDKLLHNLGNTKLPKNVTIRRLTLNESADENGRLIQMLGTDVLPPSNSAGDFGRAYVDPATEVINAGSTEVWQIVNLTGDTHPIHFHLVNVQIVSRQTFDLSSYNGGEPTLMGQPRKPDMNERGWKETVRMNPLEVTNVIMQFKLPTGLPFAIPPSPRTGGHEYVWHCHILEHEEHDMMRPLVVKP
jgi:spore coat protein A, manganese oxidase